MEATFLWRRIGLFCFSLIFKFVDIGFFHPQIESVDLALNILDGMQYEPEYVLHVERAKFQPKKDFDYTKYRRLTAKEKRIFKQKQEKLDSIVLHFR